MREPVETEREGGAEGPEEPSNDNDAAPDDEPANDEDTAEDDDAAEDDDSVDEDTVTGAAARRRAMRDLLDFMIGPSEEGRR